MDPLDHRDLARELDLLHFREEAPGMVFWHPRGWALYRVLEEAARRQAAAHGYREVRTPQLMRRAVWDASGHWRHFHEGMFRIDDDGLEGAVKPVSCPGHLYIAGQGAPSYRDLPLRYSELGVVHRNEPSGSLHGLFRLRQFTQDDGHVFAAPEQAEDEVLAFCRDLPEFYRAFGFGDVQVALSLRPADRAGDGASWDAAERALRNALHRLGASYVEQAGAGAFYGPKIEFSLSDHRGRSWQCGTIQLDLVMPERFDLSYVDARGARRRPVMLHRAVYGSLERFMGMLLEQHGRALPAWLAPTQVWVLPLGVSEREPAERALRHLRARGLRAELVHHDSLSRRIAEAHAAAVPFQVIVGPREVAEGRVAVRARGAQEARSEGEAVAELVALTAAPPFMAA